MKQLLPLVVVLLALGGATTFATPPSVLDSALAARCDELDSSGSCALYDVSIVELIANPDWYHGKRVRVVGYVRFEFEGNAIYLSKESYDASLVKNALWLDPPVNFWDSRKKREWGPRYAIVEGRFDATRLGHMSAYSGSITETTRFVPR